MPITKRVIDREIGASSLYQFVPFRQQNTYLSIGERTNANGSRAFRDALLAEEILARKKLASDISGRLTNEVLLVRTGRLESVVAELQRMGHTPQVLQR